MRVSAGSTGALLTAATLIIRRIDGVKRPALAPLLPTVQGNGVLLIDSGANTDCKPVYLQQFALMGAAYMHSVQGIENPRIGLLNNGTEAEKGSELTKATHALLLETPVNFAGNCEARDALSGDVDVIVADGFAGNVLLKGIEGTVASMLTLLKQNLYATLRTKAGAALAKPAFRALKHKLDYAEHGGAPLLGVKGGVIKAHGQFQCRCVRSRRFTGGAAGCGGCDRAHFTGALCACEGGLTESPPSYKITASQDNRRVAGILKG